MVKGKCKLGKVSRKCLKSSRRDRTISLSVDKLNRAVKKIDLLRNKEIERNIT